MGGGGRGGGSNPIFSPRHTEKFKIQKIPIFPHDAPKFLFGDGKKWGKKYMEREGKNIRFNKLLYIIINVFCILYEIFRVP